MKSESDVVGRGKGRREVRLLFTCAGRRIELIHAFMQAARRLKLEPVVVTADMESHVAAACLADRAYHVPRTRDRRYIPSLLDIARAEKIDLLIPLLDTELLKIAVARDEFARLGTTAVISSPGVVRLCRDKLKLYEVFRTLGITMPRTWSPEEILQRKRHRFPYFLKPRGGSASQGNHVIRSRADLEAFVPRVKDPIIQEFIPGVEYTLDVYTGFDGRPRCVVPRRRLEIRGGEVTKARTFHHEAVIQTGVRVAEALEHCRGVITVQLFLSRQDRIHVIEINPRFGGGVPLAIHAGADFPRWLLMEWQGRRPRIRINHFRDEVTMLRYHESFFLEKDETLPSRRPRKNRGR